MNRRLGDLLASIAGLPRWVQGWLVILVGVNTASLCFLDNPLGRWTALAFAVVAAVNVPMAWIQSGLTRLLSFTHVVWMPLLVYLITQLAGSTLAPAGTALRRYVMLVIVVDGISLIFDVLEAVRWWRGGREVLGRDSCQPSVSTS